MEELANEHIEHAEHAEHAVHTGNNFMRSEEHTSELQSQSNLVCRIITILR